MANFDEIIKKKAESAEYEFTDAAWKNFEKKSGLKRSRYIKTITIICSIAILIAGTVLLVKSNSVETRSKDFDTNQNDVSNVDSVVFSNEMIDDSMLSSKSNDNIQSVKPVTCKTSESMASDLSSVDSVCKVEKTVVSKPVKSVKLGKRQIINIDTIKDNSPSDEELRSGNSRLF